MHRLNPDPDCAALPDGPGPGIDRNHWERIAEEALARVFRTAGAGLSLPGLDERRPDPADSQADLTAAPERSAEKARGRQGFRLTLTGHGTSFTPGIGACFRFEALRHLTAASGRQLGLKAVIVVRGQVVLLPETTTPTSLSGSHPALALSAHTDRTASGTAPSGLFPWPSPTQNRSLLGLATLVLQPLQPLDRSRTPVTIGPPLCPLWLT
ncbi:MAG: hypothetical protein ACKOCM_03190 [Cyanobacteriota bacterium]